DRKGGFNTSATGGEKVNNSWIEEQEKGERQIAKDFDETSVFASSKEEDTGDPAHKRVVFDRGRYVLDIYEGDKQRKHETAITFSRQPVDDETLAETYRPFPKSEPARKNTENKSSGQRALHAKPSGESEEASDGGAQSGEVVPELKAVLDQAGD